MRKSEWVQLTTTEKAIIIGAYMVFALFIVAVAYSYYYLTQIRGIELG
jgi:hypothetical protein